jgi:ribosome-associated protein
MPPVLQVTEAIAIDADELVERFVKASGPGGQHVNKTSSAVELRFDARACPTLPPPVLARLERLAGSRLTQDGVIVLFAQNARSQEMNRQDARERLFELIRQAAEVPRTRKRTRPTYASKLRRLEGKTKRSGVKALRGKPGFD